MVNVYTEYIKELFDCLHSLFLTDKNAEVVTFEYRFDDYQPNVSQQQALIEKLEVKGVLSVASRISLAPAKQIETDLHGSKYSSVGCAGYVFEVNRVKFNEYRKTANILRVEIEEHEYDMPHLSDDKRTLYVNDHEISLDKSGKNKQLLSLLFENDDFTCTIERFAETGGEKALQNTSSYVKNTIDYLNSKVEKATGIKNFLKREGKVITLNDRFFD